MQRVGNPSIGGIVRERRHIQQKRKHDQREENDGEHLVNQSAADHDGNSYRRAQLEASCKQNGEGEKRKHNIEVANQARQVSERKAGKEYSDAKWSPRIFRGNPTPRVTPEQDDQEKK